MRIHLRVYSCVCAFCVCVSVYIYDSTRACLCLYMYVHVYGSDVIYFLTLQCQSFYGAGAG